MYSRPARNLIVGLRRHLRRVVAATLLAAFVAASLGIAVPVVVNKISHEIYPCMNCPCGCVSAEACWRDCCCYTQQQKLDWAREHGVAPPAFVVAAAQQESQETTSCCCKRDVPPCCSKKASCYSKPTQPQTAQCCQKNSRDQPIRRIVLIDVLRCQGLTSQLTLLPPCVMPPMLEAGDAPNSLEELIALGDPLVSGLSTGPEPPPPQQRV